MSVVKLSHITVEMISFFTHSLHITDNKTNLRRCAHVHSRARTKSIKNRDIDENHQNHRNDKAWKMNTVLSLLLSLLPSILLRLLLVASVSFTCHRKNETRDF